MRCADHILAQCEEMAVEAAVSGNRRLVFHAIVNDPLAAAVCSLREIEQMVNEMLEKNRPHLPQFRHFRA